MVRLADFPGVHSDVLYVVRAFSSSKLTKPSRLDSSPALITIACPVRGWDILTAYPMSTFDFAQGQVHVANLGLFGKMTGAAAIASSNFEQRENGRVLLDTRLKALGRLGTTSVPDLQTLRWHRIC